MLVNLFGDDEMSNDNASNKQEPKGRHELPKWFAEVKRKYETAKEEPTLDSNQKKDEIWPSKKIT